MCMCAFAMGRSQHGQASALLFCGFELVRIALPVLNLEFLTLEMEDLIISTILALLARSGLCNYVFVLL